MSERKTDPIRPTDEAARGLARELLDAARSGALGVIEPGTGAPLVTRIAVATTEGGAPMTLVSDLSMHTAALRAHPVCSLLVGEPGPKGDPLTHPRLSLQCTARFVAPDDPERPSLRTRWLAVQPKATLYIDFADFRLVRLDVTVGHLNGGFGKAYRLTPADLGLA
jgi:hypothetical protein